MFISSMTCSAYAKINLTLDIIGRRADGYHLLQMVMQSVSLCDTLTLCKRQSGGIVLSSDDDTVPDDPTNTVYKAAKAFFHFCGFEKENIEIDVIKRIPSQAGLAGGSADAGAVLLALNQMYDTGFPVEKLCEIGLTVGADVPFCIRGGTMLAEGTGELLTPLAPLPHCFLVLCKPPVNVNTAKAYALTDSAEFPRHPNTAAVLAAISNSDICAVCANLGNVFENVLNLEDVRKIKEMMLQNGACGACMTGSGSAVYGIFQEQSSAQSCKTVLENCYEQVFLCEPIAAQNFSHT